MAWIAVSREDGHESLRSLKALRKGSSASRTGSEGWGTIFISGILTLSRSRTKYSGFFDRYVDEDADLNECVAFLNTTGIYFGLMEVVNGTEFTAEDCARAMGQIDLVLSGDAEFSMGKVKLPKGIDSWNEFCIMNGIKYVEGHRVMLEILNVADAR